MGIGFVLTLWAVIGIIILASYLLLSRLGRRYPFAAETKRAIVPLFAAVGMTVALVITVNIVRDLFPAQVFESVFGFPPTSDVKELEGRRFIFGDSGDAFLRFRADKQTIERIVTGARLYKITEDTFKSRASSQSHWKPFEGKPTLFYESQSFDDSFGYSSAILCYDGSTGLAHFYWVGVD